MEPDGKEHIQMATGRKEKQRAPALTWQKYIQKSWRIEVWRTAIRMIGSCEDKNSNS